MKKVIFAIAFLATVLPAVAQEEESESRARVPTEEKGVFKKGNLFTGGSVVLSFSNYGSVIGASPVFGYSITRWLDAAILFNYNYASDRHVTYTNGSSYYVSDDKIRQHTYGPGIFVRGYPVNFLFVQAQAEYNFISSKTIYANGPVQRDKVSAPSLLVGAGYCNGREGTGSLFYYISILADIGNDKDSPYNELTPYGNITILPIFKAGLQIPLFQGSGGRRRNRYDD